jgi:hypothetical protein
MKRDLSPRRKIQKKPQVGVDNTKQTGYNTIMKNIKNIVKIIVDKKCKKCKKVVALIPAKSGICIPCAGNRS